MPVVDYLTDFASRQSFGMLEPHADWNQMMYSPAQELFGLNILSDVASFYAGDDFSLTFQNGTSTADQPINNKWVAFYSEGNPGALDTGGDFYNYFVLRLPPSSSSQDDSASPESSALANSSSPIGTDSSAVISTVSSPESSSTFSAAPEGSPPATSWHADNSAYPADTMVHQEGLGQFTPGSLTGYYLADSATAVLSIPTFLFFDDDSVDTFGQAVTYFINNATQQKAKNVIIDLQQNTGGIPGLALFVFQQVSWNCAHYLSHKLTVPKFFPQTLPYTGSRMRSHPLADVLGEASTARFQSLREPGDDLDDLSDEWIEDFISEWVSVVRVNAETGRNFSSWQEFSGPQHLDGDNFTLTEEYDLSNPLFDGLALEEPDDACSEDDPCRTNSPWGAGNIVILTDGICGSTCSLFVEMMHQAGVRSVAVGGSPRAGPMQAASGTRGAASYSAEQVNETFTNIGEYNSTAAALKPPAFDDTGMYLDYVGFTLRDQLRRNATIPNQMLYLPADCRLYWTLANFYNYTQLWTDVYTAMFVDPSRCVAGSTNVTSPPPPPKVTTQHSEVSISPYIWHSLSGSFESFESFEPVMDNPQPPIKVEICGARDKQCYPKDFNCRRQQTQSKVSYFLKQRSCNSSNKDRCRPQYCNTNGLVSQNKRNGIAYDGKVPIESGFCMLPWDYSDVQCANLEPQSKFLAYLSRLGL